MRISIGSRRRLVKLLTLRRDTVTGWSGFGVAERGTRRVVTRVSRTAQAILLVRRLPRMEVIPVNMGNKVCDIPHRVNRESPKKLTRLQGFSNTVPQAGRDRAGLRKSLLRRNKFIQAFWVCPVSRTSGAVAIRRVGG